MIRFFRNMLSKALGLRPNSFHPLVYVAGSPNVGKGVYVGLFSEINAKGGSIILSDNCDIASFVSINVADSHKKTIGLNNQIQRSNIVLEENVFVGSHSFIGGNTHIGRNSVVASGTILVNAGYVPPYSLIVGNPALVKKGYYLGDSTQ